MEHYLRLRVLGKNPKVEISALDYDSAAMARRALSAALAVEEKWDFLLANYIELEQELLSLATSNIALNDREYKEIFASNALVNRRLLNLLTAAKMYVDQIPQSVAEIPDITKNVKELFSEHYDACFEYRFMEAFRNYVQHRGAPAHAVTIGAAWTPEFNREWSESYVHPFAMRSVLAADGKFKRSVLNEMPEKVNLMDAARHYLERLGAVHKEVRSVLSDRSDSARATIQRLIDKYSTLHAGKPVGLAAHRAHDNGEVEKVPILLDWDDVRLYLIRRNSTLINLSKRTVSGRTNF